MTMDVKKTKKQLKIAKRARSQRQEWERLHKSSNTWSRFLNSLRMSFMILYRNKKAVVGF